MKTVTIPTSQSPFVVMVNGAKYVYPAGSVQDVPDEVAVVIEAHNKQTAKPNEPVEAPFDCDCGGGGGAQSDWNQTDSSAADFIKNKPFGDMPAGGDTLYWDGNTEGLVPVDQIDTLGMVYYKLSESTPRMEDIAEGGSLSVFNTPDGDLVMDLTVEDYGGLLFCCSGMVIVIPSDNFEIDNGEGTYLSFSEKGVYFAGSGGVVFSLTIPGYTGFPATKKMEEKYLPGAVILYGDPTLATNYLYTTEDYTDSTKRITRTQLLEAVACGRQIYISFDNGDGTGVMFTPVSLQDSIEFVGVACGMTMNDSFMALTLYTAEYTAS